jgi:hypothetical protein
MRPQLLEIHWHVIKLNERLIITAMRAGQQKLAEFMPTRFEKAAK